MDIMQGGKILSANVSGEGPSIILLHSLLADRGSFARLVTPLSKFMRVVAVDLPGFGGSTFLDGNIVDIADYLAAAIPQLSNDVLPIVLGNGFGGFVALQTAIRHPTLIRRLIIADAGAAFSEPGRQAFRNMAVAAAANGLGAVADTAMARLFSPEFRAQNPELLLERREAFLKTDIRTFKNACADLASLDLRGAARGVSMPALVLVGEQDEATPPAMGKELAALLPNASFMQLPGCAHVPQLQAPDLFLESIRSFLVA